MAGKEVRIKGCLADTHHVKGFLIIAFIFRSFPPPQQMLNFGLNEN